MNLKRILLIPSLAILVTTSATINLNASEVNTKQADSAIYAPVNPTKAEVESAALTDLVVFEDANLEQAIADELGVEVGSITVGDMESLESLSADSSNISDLTGLEYASNLTFLSVNYNQVSDLSPLSGDTNLISLELVGNEISNLSPLSNLASLKFLNLSSNQINDLSPLSNLVTLKTLQLDFNQISDLSPLYNLTDLTLLTLNNNKISNLSPLSNLTNLTYLELDGNNIIILTPLSELSNIETLSISLNQISDLSSLSNLTNLTELDLSYNQISDLSPLGSLTNLTKLDLYENKVSDLSPLTSLGNLEELYIENNQISDISPLSGLSKLQDGAFKRQSITLDDITVSNDNEILYDVTDLDGSVHSVSLGKPEIGSSTITGSWDITTLVNGKEWLFSGEVKQFVTYSPDTILSTITGNATATTDEETALSNEELITLFDVSTTDDSAISVDQSIVDYSTPGDYQVTFTDEAGNEFIATLTITDVLPTITSDNNLTITLGSNIDDYITSFNAIATEITDSDLSSSITVDSSNVDFNSTGNYDIVFNVTDEEGNKASTTSTLVIERDLTETSDIDTITPELTTDDSDSDIDSEVSDNEEDSIINKESSNEDDSEVSIANTGSKIVAIIIALLAVIIIILVIKKFLKEK